MRTTLLSASLLAGILLAAPDLEAGYAPGCTVKLDLGAGPVHEARAVALQPDGRIIVAGYVDLGVDRDFLVARLHPDLTLDASFNGGWTAIDFTGGDDEAMGVAIQTDQKIVVVGYAENNGGSKRYLALARFLPDGTVDPGFGAFFVDFPGSSFEELRGVALQPDGKIVAAGYHTTAGPTDVIVARFLKDGSFDTSFDLDGFAEPVLGDPAQASDVVIAPDDNIVLSATGTFSGDNDFVAIRLRPDGSLDPGFAGGWAAMDIGNFDDDATSVALDGSGNVVVAGTSSADFAIARYRPDGTPDGSFGGGSGFIIHDIGTDTGSAMALDGSGNIVVAGEGGAPDFALTRFNNVGANTLQVSHDIVNDDRAFALAIRKDGKFLLAGTSQAPANPQATLALFNSDGTQDCSEVVLHPEADGASTDFTPAGCANWDCVNDQPGNALIGPAVGHDGGATEVTSAAPTSADLYRLTDPALPPGSVVTEIEIVGWLAWGNTGAVPSFQLLYQRQGFDVSDVRGSTLAVSNTIFTEFRQSFSDLNWNQAELDALEIGVEHTLGDDLRLTQMYVIVKYGEPLVQPVEPFTAASTGVGASGQVTLNWLNPSFGKYDETMIRRDTSPCPLTPGAGTLVIKQNDGPGQPGTFVDAPPIGPTYYYAAFVEDAEDHVSVGQCLEATPFDRTAAKVDWIYSTSDPISALATPGLRVSTNVVYTTTNDGAVHAMKGGDGGLGGGSWPVGWKPYRLGAPAPNRPPVVQLPSSAWAALFGAEDGHVYAVNAVSGALLWRSPKLGMLISSSPAAIVTAFGGAQDLVFIGTRDAGQPNRFYALNADDGTVAWYFDNGGTPSEIGIITSAPSVSYPDQRVYFTSYAGGSGKTVWCLDFGGALPVKCGAWTDFGVSTSFGGDVDASPILFSGLLFVSDLSPGETLDAVNPADGTVDLIWFLGGGGARDYVFPRFGTLDVIVSTANEVLSVETATKTLNWTPVAMSSPSAPLQVIGTGDIYVGGSDGKLHRLSAIVGGPGTTECIGDCATTVVGSPAYDFSKLMIYLGTDEGNIYGVKTPF